MRTRRKFLLAWLFVQAALLRLTFQNTLTATDSFRADGRILLRGFNISIGTHTARCQVEVKKSRGHSLCISVKTKTALSRTTPSDFSDCCLSRHVAPEIEQVSTCLVSRDHATGVDVINTRNTRSKAGVNGGVFAG